MEVNSDTDQARLQVADPEEFNQTERLRAVNDARRRVEEANQATMVQSRTDEYFDESDRQQILRAAVYRYLTNIEWLAEKADATELLAETSFGTVELEPPPEIKQLITKRDGYPRVVGGQRVTTYEHEINGIHGYLTAPEVFRHTWTVDVNKRHTGTTSITRSRATHMPTHISLNAFRMANQFLANNGFDVELSPNQHRAVVDNAVLNQIEQWRQDNINQET